MVEAGTLTDEEIPVPGSTLTNMSGKYAAPKELLRLRALKRVVV
jgi:hypothetical protein